MILVRVEWWDAHSKDEWHDVPVQYIPLVVTSVGYVREGTTDTTLVLSEGITLMPNKCTEDQCFGTVHIPSGCIKSITVLKEDESET